MILVDANVLLYSYDEECPSHELARRWLERELSSGRSVRFALVTLLAFIRIASDRRVFSFPMPGAEACRVVQTWLNLPAARLLQPGPRTWKILEDLCRSGQAAGPLVMDAHLAALAIEHGATIATTDRDFARFSGVSFLNPLEDG